VIILLAVEAASAGVSQAQTVPTVKVPTPAIISPERREAIARDIARETLTVRLDTVVLTPRRRRELASLISHLVSRDTTWCNSPATGIHFCGLQVDTSIGHIAAKHFWDQRDAGGFTAVKMMNIQGLGDKQAQSVYTELISDLWNAWRIGLGGVFTTKADTTGSGSGVTKKSQVQQFLNGGGPAVITLARPLVVANLAGTRTVGLFRGQAAFAAPGANQQSADSTKYADLGLDAQSTMVGAAGKIGGIVTMHVGRVFGGKKFYDGFGTAGSFTVGHYSLGLLIENAVRVSWTRLFLGPSRLIDQSDLITVNVVR
jgi:hypothetical protein